MKICENRQAAFSNIYFELAYQFKNIFLNKSDRKHVDLQICYNLPQIGKIATKTLPVLLIWQIYYHD